MKQAFGVAVDYPSAKNIGDDLSLPIAGAAEVKVDLVHHPLSVEHLSCHSINDPAQRSSMEGIVDKVTAGLEHAVRFAARLREIGDVLECLHGPDSVKSGERAIAARERQCSRIGVHKRNLASDQRPEHLLRMKQIGAHKIDNYHANIGTCCKPTPMPTPASANIQNETSLGHLREKTINLTVHHRNGMVAGDFGQIIVVMQGCNAFT